MTDHPLAHFEAPDRRPHLVSWTWLTLVLFVVGFWTTVALLLESAIGS